MVGISRVRLSAATEGNLSNGCGDKLGDSCVICGRDGARCDEAVLGWSWDIFRSLGDCLACWAALGDGDGISMDRFTGLGSLF